MNHMYSGVQIVKVILLYYEILETTIRTIIYMDLMYSILIFDPLIKAFYVCVGH